ncbi:SDR family oxidoreductase [Paenibacillus gallinarum]|uniref:SDR family oxidoreductase n=1 Tax=Paenibacillus gallinarum TaxID=2762232 RepID=A0ABR8SU22_9BACL|nr:SDR family oxidoreductase [Paenibacillus gallinarum]MBD7966614.1 SDR family oxidoreductase [Paenibacillus gallinarum]
MNTKIAIVTGANSGMGLATSMELALQGYHVVMACRNEERGRIALKEAITATGSKQIELMKLDLGSLHSIRSFVSEFTANHPKLDVLINNAGVVCLRREETSDGFEMTLGVNHLGHYLLTRLLIPSLKAAAEARVINVSSGAYKVGKIHREDPNLKKRYHVIKSYSQSKLANILFTRELAERLQGTNITVNALHPGAVGTNIGINRTTGFGTAIMAMVRKIPSFLTPEEGARTAIYLAVHPEVKGITGEYFYEQEIQELKPNALDKETATFLWNWSAQQTGLPIEIE